MKYADVQMVMFVGGSLLHDYWIIWGLPRIYYIDLLKEQANK